MIEMSLEFKYAQGKWTLVTVNIRIQLLPQQTHFNHLFVQKF